MKFKIIAAAVATSLASANFVSDLMASTTIVGSIVRGELGRVDLSRYSSESSIVVVVGYPELDAQDEDADIMLFRAGYIAYNFTIVTLLIVAKDHQAALRKANVFKEGADELVLSRFPENGAGKLHVSSEPISNADAVLLASDADILLTIH